MLKQLPILPTQTKRGVVVVVVLLLASSASAVIRGDVHSCNYAHSKGLTKGFRETASYLVGLSTSTLNPEPRGNWDVEVAWGGGKLRIGCCFLARCPLKMFADL